MNTYNATAARAALTNAAISTQISSRSNKSISQSYTDTNREVLVLPYPKASWLILSLVAVFSVLSFIYIKDYNRNLFATYQNLQNEYTMSQETEGKLLMEQGMVASRTRIQEIAERDLDMQMPVAKSVVIVKV